MKKILVSIMSILLGISMMAQNNSKLKLNLEKNKVYRLKTTSEQTISQTVNGVQQTTNVKSNSVVSLKMKDATPDFMIAEIRFDTIVSITNAMGKIITVNSALDGNMASSEMTDVMTCIMNRLSKNAMYVKMDYSGKLIELINSKMLEDIIMKDTSEITGAMAPMIRMQIKNTINGPALISMVEPLTNNLPGKDNTSADKWDNRVSMNSGGMSLDINTSYHLGSIKDHAATITGESNIQTSANAEPMNYGGAKITYDDIKGLGKSTIILDTRTGLLIESTTKTKIAGNLSINAQGMSMQIPMEIDMESKVVSL